jgi:hypothetical protein
MQVGELKKLFEKLPDNAEILVAHVQEDKFDVVAGVERLILSDLKSAGGGKVIAGIIRFRCHHR